MKYECAMSMGIPAVDVDLPFVGEKARAVEGTEQHAAEWPGELDAKRVV